MTDVYSKYDEMLKEFKRIGTEQRKSTRTFMEVSGYPHFENVASNILAFFFTSNEEHGFEDLFFKSLLDLIPNATKLQHHIVSADRECVTPKRNRVDLVLRDEVYVVGIENKIFSGVQNDLQDYKDSVDIVARRENKEALHLLLSMRDEQGSIVNHHPFVNITYETLFSSINRNLGDYIEFADNTWLIYLKDFMKTIRALGSGVHHMNGKLLNFVNRNSKTVGKLLEDCYWLKRQFAQETKKLSGLINLEEYRRHMTFTEFCYNPKVDVTSSFVIDIDKEQGKILVVETYIDASGWHIAVWNRYGERHGKAELEKTLKEKGYVFHNHNKDADADRLFIVLNDYGHDVSLDLLMEGIYTTMNLAKIVDI